MKSNKQRKTVSISKLLYSLIFAFFVLFQGVRFSNIDTVYVTQSFLSKDMLLGYLTIFIVLPFLILFFMYIPLLLIIDGKAMFDFNLRVKIEYQSYQFRLKNIFKQNIKQSSLGVFRC